MASVFLHVRRRKLKDGTVRTRKVWTIKWKNAAGVMERKETRYPTKAEARRAAQALESSARLERDGVQVGVDRTSEKTLGDLMCWWLKHHSAKTPSHAKNLKTVEKHIIGTQDPKPGRPVHRPDPISRLRLWEVAAGKLNAWLDAKEEAGLSEQSLNHLRMFVFRAFAKADSRDWWKGSNPAAKVEIRHVPDRTPSYLQPEEVPQVLRHVAEQWRDFFACAVYTAMRKGEIAGLRKGEIDFDAGRIVVGHSYDRDRPKGGDEKPIPLHPELVPYLKHAMEFSEGEYVFRIPTLEDDGLVGEDNQLGKILRSALRRANIVTGYRQHCNGRGCGYKVETSDDVARRCERCNRRLLVVGIPRRIRFHDLRHTTASLLLMAGAPMVVV